MREGQKRIELIRDLANAFGPTGCEGAVAERILSEIRPFAHRITRDRMGNLIAEMRFGAGEDRLRLMVSAHMDEVGMMVTEVREDGTLLFDTVGGIDLSVLAGRRVTVGDESRQIPGVIASKAVHHKDQKEREKAAPLKKLYIDMGAKAGDEAKQYASVGSFATFESEFFLFGKDERYMKGKALDDRCGCAVMIEVMEALAKEPPTEDLEIFFCFTVREEIGLSGAGPVAQRLCPDFALVLESTAVADLEGVDRARQVARLGQGGAISLMDRSTIYDRALCDGALSLASSLGIPAQIKQYVSGGNDAGHIHKSGVGVRTLALSLPTRYLHSPACVASLEDYDAICRLTEAMLRNSKSIGGNV